MAHRDIDRLVTEFHHLAFTNVEQLTISDEKYARELYLQETILSNLPSRTRVFGESSHSKQIICGICMESKQSQQIFSGLHNCNNHVFCIGCIREYVTRKIKENIAFIECPQPQCKNTIQPDNCNYILPKEVSDRWENALCEALILGVEKFYCPYKDCSALMVDDSGKVVVQAECPNCRRLFCARCHVNWHDGITCEAFQRLKEGERGSDDIKMMKLAKDKKWRRCSNCSFYVEKSQGCNRMTCRCKYQFCYKCGSKWTNK